MPTEIRVLIVDDHAMVREGLKRLLEVPGSGIKVVGLASNGIEALEAMPNLTPQIVMMDIRMPVMDGIAATRQLHRDYPEVKVIALTTFDDEEYLFQVLQAGAVSYILKDISPEELVLVVQRVFRGDAVLSPGITGKLIQQAVRGSTHIPEPTAPVSGGFVNLSIREREVLNLLAQGLENNPPPSNNTVSK